jgi:transposase
LRYAILSHARDAAVFFCQKTGHVKCCYGGKLSCDNRRCLIEDVPVFAILEDEGSVGITIIPNMTPGDLIRADVKKVRMGSLIYTDRHRGFDSLLYYGYHHERVKPEDQFPPDYLYINRGKGFSVWLRRCFPKYYGVSSINFPLYIKETEFRYNHRHSDLFQILTEYVCDLMPMAQQKLH